jgi:putative addiction module killer protein
MVKKLKDYNAKARINIRIRRIEEGNLGDVKSVGSGVSEIRIDYGPGYRLYLTKRGQTIILLLCGGDKTTQEKDIQQAKEMIK